MDGWIRTNDFYRVEVALWPTELRPHKAAAAKRKGRITYVAFHGCPQRGYAYCSKIKAGIASWTIRARKLCPLCAIAAAT